MDAGDSTPQSVAPSAEPGAGSAAMPTDVPTSRNQHSLGPFTNTQTASALEQPEQTDRMLAVISHVGPALLVFSTIASGGVLAPLPLAAVWIWWLATRNRSVFLDDHGRESINFQISMGLYAIIVLIAGIPTCSAAWWVGIPILSVIALVGCILAIRASLLGRPYRYPATLRLVSPAL